MLFKGFERNRFRPLQYPGLKTDIRRTEKTRFFFQDNILSSPGLISRASTLSKLFKLKIPGIVAIANWHGFHNVTEQKNFENC